MSEAAVLPDPRDPAPTVGNVLVETARQQADAPLHAAIRDALEAGDDAVLREALRCGPPALARCIRHALAAVLDAGGGEVGLRLFAIPLIIVAGASRPLNLSGVLPDSGRIKALLEEYGAVGVTRNFGLGNALCGAEALEALSPAALWRAGRDPAEGAVAAALPPQPVAVGRGREQVHLRFITGVGITPPQLPSFLESASNIGSWGMPLTRELARQLAQPGLEVLPMPRPPQPLAQAADAGRRAQLEAALDLFLGNTVRRFRMAVGDPEAVLSAHRLDGGAGELRLSLSSPFDESLFEGFCWPLHPLDEVAEVTAILLQALADCRIGSVTPLARVLPDRLPGGSSFIAGRMLDGLTEPLASH